MGREGTRIPFARRLVVAAAGVLVCAVAAVPFVGAPPVEDVATLGGRASDTPADDVAAAGATPAAGRPIAPAPTSAPAPAVVAPTRPLPPPPPAPPGLSADTGAADGDGVPAVSPEVIAAGPPAPVTTVDAPGRRVWAVVVGIDDYPGTGSDLRAARADAADLAAALLSFGVPADHVLAVYDGAATIDGLLEGVAWLVANAGPDDTAVFLYAGHVRDLGGGTEAVITADGGWITDWYLADRFAGLAARDAWFVVAGCYGGGFDELLGPGRVLTAAAGPGQLAYENDGYGRSYLAEFVLRRALLQRAAPEPTVQAAVAWATDELERQHPDRQVWHADSAGHVVSLDGVRRDGSSTPGDQPAAPPPTSPPGGCFLGILGRCGD